MSIRPLISHTQVEFSQKMDFRAEFELNSIRNMKSCHQKNYFETNGERIAKTHLMSGLSKTCSLGLKSVSSFTRQKLPAPSSVAQFVWKWHQITHKVSIYNLQSAIWLVSQISIFIYNTKITSSQFCSSIRLEMTSNNRQGVNLQSAIWLVLQICERK